MLSCVVASLGFDIAVSFVTLCCGVLSLSPIKDGLPQYCKGGDGRRVQVSQGYEQAETFNSLRVVHEVVQGVFEQSYNLKSEIH